MTATAEQEREPAPPESQDQQLEKRSNVASSIGFGLSASNWDQGFRIANALAKSSMVPKAYQNHPEDIVVAMQLGAEIGLPPMASLQSIAVINGKPGVYGDGFLGVIMSKPAYAKHVEYYELADGVKVTGLRRADYDNDDTKAVSMFWRKGNPDPFVAEFSIGDAKRAKLWGKEGPWSQYPARQLKWRARGFAGRDGFPAELRGIKMAEELFDYPDIEVATIHQEPIAEPVRRSDKAPAPATDQEPSAATESVLTTELPPEKGTAQPAATKGKATKPAGDIGAAAAKGGTPATGVITTTEHLAFSESAYVQPKGGDPFFELRAYVQKEGAPPVGYVFRTRDEALYKLAESCEGTNRAFTVKWHAAKTPDGTNCKVIDAIEAAD